MKWFPLKARVTNYPLTLLHCNIYHIANNNKGTNMPNYSEIKAYWTKFATEAGADVTSFWTNYVKTLESIFKK